MVSADMGDVDFCNPADLEGDRFKCTADSSKARGPRLFGTLALQLDYATPQIPLNGEQRDPVKVICLSRHAFAHACRVSRRLVTM
jgi:hypothetical protein